MYSQIYRNILFPAYELILGRNTLKYLKYLEKTQWFSEERLKELQWSKLQKLLKHAYENVPYYRNKFEKLGLNHKENIDLYDFSRIPFLTKCDIRNNRENLIAQNYKNKKIFKSATGGSTGEPVQIKLDHDNYEWRQAAVKRVYGWADYGDGDKTVFIWGGGIGKESFPKKIKHSLDEWLKRHKIYNTFYFDSDTISRCVSEINRFKPKIIVAYASPLYNFAKFIKEKNKQIWLPRSIISAAEKIFPFQRKLIEEVFHCPIFETYGCREVTSIAGECEKHNGMHINMENIYVEVIKENDSANPGEIGEIVLTDLTNSCMPLIRYKNEDIGSISDRECKCGRGLVLLDKVEGRLLDTIKTKEGRMVPGEFFPHLMKEFEEIEKFQVIQEDINTLVIKIVERKEFASDKYELLKYEIRKVVGQDINVKFQFIKEIPLTQTGKFRVVISKVSTFPKLTRLKDTVCTR